MDIIQYELSEKTLPKQSLAPKVFCDLDGVLADFYGGMMAAYPAMKIPTDVEKFLDGERNWGQVWKEHPHLFRTLPLLADAKVLMTGLLRLRDKGYIRLAILSAIPSVWADQSVTRQSSATDKKQWVQEHFPTVNIDDIIVCRRSEKVQYALEERVEKHPIPILIDDFPKNIHEWENIGKSFGILHTSAQSSLMALYHYLQG